MTKKKSNSTNRYAVKSESLVAPNPQMPFSGTTASFWYILIEKSTNIQGYMNIYTFI